MCVLGEYNMKLIEELLKDEVQMLIGQFHLISSKGWIKSINKGLGSIGYTFEMELGKLPDSLRLPDYYGTELKCTGRYSRYPISLFTVSFDGPTFPEINRIVDKYGYPDKDFKDKKVLFASVSSRYKILLPSGYYLGLDIDKKEEKIYLCAYDSEGSFIERKSFVYFKSVYDHLYLKLNRLALIYASKKIIDGEAHFRYYKIVVYLLKDFDTFLKLLEKGIIKVSLIARISKSGVDEGRYRNKNLVFQIKKDKLNKLFDELYYYDYDRKFN